MQSYPRLVWAQRLEREVMGWELDRTWCEGLHFDVLAETSGNESENGSPKKATSGTKNGQTPLRTYGVTLAILSEQDPAILHSQRSNPC